MDMFEKQRRITKLAEKDLSYTTWNKIFEETEEDFRRYADSQPEEIRNFLWGYAQSGQMKNQRLLNLACEYMEFPEEK